MNIFALSALINGVIALVLAVFVISRNWTTKSNRLYFLLGFAVSLWSFGYWQWQLSTDENSALFWVRILSMGSTLIPVFYFHWIAVLLEKEKREKKLIIFNYILAFIILIFSFSTLFIKNVVPKLDFPFWPNPGILYHIYLAYIYCILITYSIFLLFREYGKSSKERKAQIVYVLIGSIVGFGGGLFNFFLWYNIPILPYGNFLVALYPFFLGYASLRYHLFEVKVVATETLTFVIWIVLFIRTLLSSSTSDMVINFVILVVLVFAGIFLVRSVLKEVKQREELEKLTNEIKRAYEVEKNAYAELKKLDELKNQFTVATQHHLRTPLTSMRGYMDLILSGTYGKVPKKLEEPIKKFDISTKRLIKIVNEFLDISQFQMGKKVVSVKPGVEVLPILQEAVEELKFEAESKKLYLKLISASNDPVKATADSEKLKVALFNLVDNAIKYTKDGGVTITVSKNEKVHISIKDTGIGMAFVDNNIFNKTFERGEEAKKVFTTGRGIGLYITSQIIKAHGGKLWAESEGIGKGSTFNLELPLG